MLLTGLGEHRPVLPTDEAKDGTFESDKVAPGVQVAHPRVVAPRAAVEAIGGFCTAIG